MDDWKKVAESLQQYFCDGLGDRKWDLFRSHERWALETKIAVAVFGGIIERNLAYAVTDCSEVPVSRYYEDFLESTYSEEQRREIRKICNKIYETTASEEVCVAFLFVVGISGNYSYIQPVFRVFRLHRYGECRFIDSFCHVYEDWWDFKANNKLLAGKACYPDYGIYMKDMNGLVCIHYADTPAGCKKSDKLAGFDLLDATLMLSIASPFVPAVAPFVPILISSLRLTRIACTLRDRLTHHQEITKEECLRFSMSLAGNSLSIIGNSVSNPLFRKIGDFVITCASKVNGARMGNNWPVSDHTDDGLAKLIMFVCIKHKKEFIHLIDGIRIAVKKVVNYLARLFRRFFTSEGKNTFPHDKIILFVESSEKFAQSQECRTESDFMDFSTFMCIYIKNRAMQMEKNYQREKDEVKKLFGEKFNEVQFAVEHGLENEDERESMFLSAINDEIKISNEELREKFDTMVKEITSVNEDGGLKFKSNHVAMKVYFEIYVIGGEEISVSEFFSIIREAVEDKKSIKTHSKIFITHENEVVSVCVDESNKNLLSVKFLE